MSRGESDKYRRKGKYKRWRKRVLERDGHKCVECGSTEKLTVDHIKPLVQYPELAYEVSNGQTLCEGCRVKGVLVSLGNGELKNPCKKRVVNDKKPVYRKDFLREY